MKRRANTGLQERKGTSIDARLGTDWPTTIGEARLQQEAMRAHLVVGEHLDQAGLSLIAGCDVSFSRATNRVYAAVVVLSYPELDEVETAVADGAATFPYVPGFLVYREGPVLARALAALTHAPDLIVFDGHGLAHPRRFGIASYFGVLLNRPTIGVGKSRLVGEYQEPGPEVGATAALTHKGDLIGCVLRTKLRVKPVFVSVGHRTDLDQAAQLVLECCRGYRLPEPTRLAHLRSNAWRRENGG